jgi:hypothetical protein
MYAEAIAAYLCVNEVGFTESLANLFLDTVPERARSANLLLCCK